MRLPPISECPNKLIESCCLRLNLAEPASKHRGGVHVTLTWHIGDELENTHHHDVMSFYCPLVLAFSIQAINYEFDFDLLSGVAVDQVIPPSGDNIGILLSSSPAK